jgi:hypothetical protein
VRSAQHQRDAGDHGEAQRDSHEAKVIQKPPPEIRRPRSPSNGRCRRWSQRQQRVISALNLAVVIKDTGSAALETCLATLLWGSPFDARARQNLRQTLLRLRRVLGPGALVGDGEEISIVPGVIDCDVTRLEALSRDGGPLRPPQPRPSR